MKSVVKITNGVSESLYNNWVFKIKKNLENLLR